MEAGQLFKALSDPTRLRCLNLLASNEELCVCELTHALGLPQPKVSHHLAALRRSQLVQDRKSGLWIYYRLNQDLPGWVMEVIQATTRGISREPPYLTDLQALAEMSNRTNAVCSA